MIIKKITMGYVVQVFETDKPGSVGRCISQEFFADRLPEQQLRVSYEHEDGTEIDDDEDAVLESTLRQPFHMEQPLHHSDI